VRWRGRGGEVLIPQFFPDRDRGLMVLQSKQAIEVYDTRPYRKSYAWCGTTLSFYRRSCHGWLSLDLPPEAISPDFYEILRFALVKAQRLARVFLPLTRRTDRHTCRPPRLTTVRARDPIIDLLADGLHRAACARRSHLHVQTPPYRWAPQICNVLAHPY
jgi:hypothetical protein